MKEYGEKIQILAGGGIRAENVRRVIEKTGVSRVHFGGTGILTDPSTLKNPTLNFGAGIVPPNEGYIAVNEAIARSVLETL